MPASLKPSVEKSSLGAGVSLEMPVNRIASLDVYRGFVMLLMMAEIISLPTIAKSFPHSSFWNIASYNQSHVLWTWLSLHDMIQPSFTFLVGVVLPFSIAARKNKGGTFIRILRHTFTRSLVLILLGIFLRSLDSERTNFTFEDTLTQIGLGYTFLVMLGFCSGRIQVTALIVILLGYWLAFALYPLPGPGFDYSRTGVPVNWEHNRHGFAAHWNKNTNLAWAADRWFLNLFPRKNRFEFNEGGYSTLSFIPTLGTMILGLLAGGVLRSNRGEKEKVACFIITGVSLISLGLLLQVTNINPIVKRIWTPAWAIFSGGICFLFLVFFYWLADIAHYHRSTFIFSIIGVNSIAAYVMSDGGIRQFISKNLHTHLGQNYDQLFGTPYATLFNGILVLMAIWLILYWMYRKKIFIKI